MNETPRNAATGPSWFAVGIRALATLAKHEGVSASAAIACEVHTHAVFLRRVLAQLARAGIVEAREGRDGGYLLLRAPATITLADIYRAVNAPSPLLLAPMSVGAAGFPGDAPLRLALDEIGAEVEQHVLQVLGRHTLADVIARAGVHNGGR